jgi:myo-inositol 2-dehydrogenase/D-chiro-inositol 1-dehydrogenase
MAEVIRVGFIGGGGNARGHMRRVREVEGAQIAGVCDVVPELAREAGELAGAEAYTDHRALLDRGDLDAVFISIPVFAHGAPELDTIARGLPFLVEKPVALDLATATAIEAAARAKGVMVAVGYQLRYAGTVDVARERLARQRIGLVIGRYWCNSGSGDPDRWLRQMEKSGGQLVEQATHTIDMMRYLGGEIAEVFCYQTRQVLDQIDCPDFNACALRFENGAVGTLTTAWCYEPDWQNANIVDVLYENTRLCWSASRLTVVEGNEAREVTAPGPNIDEIFLRAVRERNPSLIRSPYEDGVRSLAVSLAMNESAASGQPVAVAV